MEGELAMVSGGFSMVFRRFVGFGRLLRLVLLCGIRGGYGSGCIVAAGEIGGAQLLAFEAGGIGQGFGVHVQAGELGGFERGRGGKAAAGGHFAVAPEPLLPFEHVDEEAVRTGADARFDVFALAQHILDLAVERAVERGLLDEAASLLDGTIPRLAELGGVRMLAQAIGGLERHPHALGRLGDRPGLGEAHDELMLARGRPAIMTRADGNGGEGEVFDHGGGLTYLVQKCNGEKLAEPIADSLHFRPACGQRSWPTRPTARLCRALSFCLPRRSGLGGFAAGRVN